ncbi:uncharacterized protein LOC126734535 isoform X2 [Anthonomus grandis grandis]|uniref:uncharacterized protein LOC126734535 isoform X2 n=1 Tax=Anthonomus grandis grandis TaxID=2921223 RepID=UPI0021667BCF|nr:uncharacterized protein LOC126734535 isoform X2 [Anthonomus grandis grandis]
MIRNLVLKLPSLKATSENVFTTIVRKRSFRSLSPVKALSSSYTTERSLSCSRSNYSSKVANRRSLCFTKPVSTKESVDISDKEVQWREDPAKKPQVQNKPEDDFNRDSIQTLEQYELEAARPRCSKSRDLIDAFVSKSKIDSCFHLQPCHMRPYGSPDNLYSVMLIRPTTVLKYPKKPKKFVAKDAIGMDLPKPKSNKSRPTTPKSQCRSFSTNPLFKEPETKNRSLSTTKSCIAKVGSSTNDDTTSIKESLKFPSSPKNSINVNKPNPHNQHWSLRQQILEFSPPRYQNFNAEDVDPFRVELSTPEMRRNRKEQQNRNGSENYKSCYSDLIKIKLKERQENVYLKKTDISCISANKYCHPCLQKNKTSAENETLKAFKISPSSRGLRTEANTNEKMTTKSAIDVSLLSKNRNEVTNLQSRSFSKFSMMNANILSKEKIEPQCNSPLQTSRSFAKCDKDYIRIPKKPKKCIDICDPVKKAMGYKKKKGIPYEPEKCPDEEEKNRPKKIFLPSKVRLPVPPCTPRPPYEDCKVPVPCPDRADMCLEILPKKLPKLPPNDCPCIDQPMPDKNPRLERLCFKFEDPPRGICHPPPCQTPRADDSNPYKFKPLKPYVPQDCACIEPPPLVGVKMKRLPKCFPDEVCRPVRVCPPEKQCPPRADECYKIVPKKLPMIECICPCIEPPRPTIAPPIKRLNLKVPEPKRVCPEPHVCECVDRADACIPPKKKKLPKFVPGDCPCEDKPMVDWNLKRLICEDEEIECPIELPDPCKDFPRADWGCWEYSEDTCAVIDEKCDHRFDPCDPPPPPKPCRRKDICEDESAGPLNYTRTTPKRKFSTASISSSLKLYENLKNNTIDSPTFKLSSTRSVASVKQKEKSLQKRKSATNLFENSLKKSKSTPVIHLIKMLNEKPSDFSKNDLLFKPRDDEKVNYQKILTNIANSSTHITKKVGKPGTILSSFRKPKPTNTTLTVASRAISTTEQLKNSEENMKKNRETKVKEKCKKIKPSLKSLMCKKPCPKLSQCGLKCNVSKAHRLPGCKFERIPVCCDKEEAPYSAYSDNFPDTIRPFLTKTPQWNCERQQYGYYPVGRKEQEGLDIKKKGKGENKNYSTSAPASKILVPNKGDNGVVKQKNMLLRDPSSVSSFTTKPPLRSLTSQVPLKKEFLKKLSAPRTFCSQSRSIATKVFEIHFPETNKRPRASAECGKDSYEVSSAPAISCETISDCEADQRWCCKRDFVTTNVPRKPPPFPAFSDCLDEEMEDILTECPLDKEKYLKLQPRYTHLPRHHLHIKPPPPKQGKIDLLKEQDCLREKLCLENQGVTQSCTEFGQPVQLLRSKNLVTDENWDCKRVEELKKVGRWPPLSSLKNRRYFSTVTPNFRSYSTLGFSNFTDEESNQSSATKRKYVRNFHILTKSNKTVFKECADSVKKVTQKLFPNIDENTKLLKLTSNQWRIHNLIMHEKLNKQCNIARNVKRFYSSYKIKRRNIFGKKIKYGAKRGFTTGRRFYQGREKCKIKTNKRTCPKFTLNNCPPKAKRKAQCQKVVPTSCTKPFSPYPAFSECKDHELLTPFCECAYDEDKMEDLQPQFNQFKKIPLIMKEYPSQKHVNKTLGREYYKCKHGIQTTGQTIGCDSLGECLYTRDGQPASCDKIDEAFRQCHQRGQNSCEKNIVEVLVQDHQLDPTCCKESCNNYCDTEREKLKELCMKECLKSIPCTLPEEEKYCICKERCDCVIQQMKDDIEANELCQDHCQKNAKDSEVVAMRRRSRPTSEDCELQQKTKLRSVRCIKVPERPKSMPCQDACENVYETFCETVCEPKPVCNPIPKKVVCCKEVTVKPPCCPPKASKSFTQLETLWQKVVNYFKARPNCPAPGDYKKKALKEKAEKAAKKAGLIVVDPKCLPDDVVESFKAPKKECCKVCPNQDPCEIKAGTRSSSPEPNRRTYSTASRSFSRSISCENLNEINKMITESQLKERQILYQNYRKKNIAIFPDRKDSKTSEAMKMSLDMRLGKKWVNLAELCRPEGANCPKTYFGYTDIIPSRENILERAWRISIEAYSKHNYPRTYNFFNEFFTRVENSVKSMEDLEKLKTESVLRELDQFLQCDDSYKKKK